MIIEVSNLVKTLRGNCVLNDVSLAVRKGEVVGLCGPNGSGKTMVMRAIAGLIKPTSGVVKVEGEQLWKDVCFPRSIGVLIESPAFLDDRTAYENLNILAKVRNVVQREDIEDVLRRVGLDPFEKKKFRKYSLGMKQRLGLAAALMESPSVILLDEPTNALDESGVEMAKRLILEEKARGAGIVLSCHDAAVLESLSDQIVYMSGGRVVRRERRGAES